MADIVVPGRGIDIVNVGPSPLDRLEEFADGPHLAVGRFEVSYWRS